jgi:hypothetical protein
MNTMRIKNTLAALLALGLACSAHALSLSDALGTVVSGEPADPPSEVTYINNLLGMGVNSAAVIAGHSYNHFGIDTSLMPAAVAAGGVKNETGSNTVNVTGFTYLLGKYDGPNGGDIIWNVANLSGSQTIPSTFMGLGLSHWSLYNPTGTSVPDGGATMALLGFSLLCVEILRRKLKLV